MKCLKCFSVMVGPDIILDTNIKYLSIDPDKYIAINAREINIKKLEEEKLSFIRSMPAFNMQAKLSMCCLNCGSLNKVGSNIKLKSNVSIQKFAKNLLNRKF